MKLVSIIIVNYNGHRWLENCFNSLYKQTYKNFEIIFVDNNSNDKSISYISSLQGKFKKRNISIHIIEAHENYGFAKGNNIGLEKAKGEYLILLNNDTIAATDYVEKFITVFDKNKKVAVAQSKILQMNKPDLLDQCGSYWTDSTMLYHYGFSKSAKNKMYNKSFPVFSAMGASLITKRSIVNQVGLFDDSFSSYYEETDFCHRVWLAGFECWYWPKATIQHSKGGTSKHIKSAHILFHSNKNKIRSFIKNFSLYSLLLILPVHLLVSIPASLVSLIRLDVPSVFSFYRGIAWNLSHIKDTLRERKKVQSYRRVSDSEIFDKIRYNPRLSYYVHLITGLDKYED